MRKLLIILLLLCSTSYADESDITQAEVLPDIAKWVLSSVDINMNQTATVTYKKVDANGNYISEFYILFKNEVDNPNTPEDESTTEFMQFIAYVTTRIRAGDSFKLAIQKAVKAKLGI